MAGSGSPCGACKFLRRKCAPGCIFAPYFCSEQLAVARFAAVHKIFGAGNAAKLLQHLSASERSDAVVAIAYEAEQRIKDPVYGCVGRIMALQQQVATLQEQVVQAKAQFFRSMAYTQMPNENQWHTIQLHGFGEGASPPEYSLDGIDREAELFLAMSRSETQSGGSMQPCNMKWQPDHDELGDDLQALAWRMGGNEKATYGICSSLGTYGCKSDGLIIN